MKQVILMIALFGTVSTEATAQSNRTYYSGMQDEQILENERRGGTPSSNMVKLSLGTETIAQEERQHQDNNAGIRMNTIQQHQGFRMNTVQQFYGGTGIIGPSETLYRGSGYDTSKNNGVCIGCGSGAITDHRPWLLQRR